MTDADLDTLSKGLFERYVTMNPGFATAVGIHTYDHLLPKGTRGAVGEETRLAKSYLSRVEALPTRTLSRGKRVDRGVLRNALRLWVFQNEEVRIWESRPSGADELGDYLFPLFIRNFAPLAKRLASLTERLERAPKFLGETKSRVRSPTKLYSEIALETVAQTPGFLDVIESAGKEALPGPDFGRIREAVEKTKEALRDQERWIRERLLPKGSDRVGIGAAKFRRLVALREFGLTVDQIRALGLRYLRESKRELARLASEIRGGVSIQAAAEIVKADHPADWKAALAETARAMEEAKRFIVGKGLATLPPNEVLRVTETPAYMRHVIPFAAYFSPGRFDPVQEGFYVVTPHEDHPEMLKEAYLAGIRNTAVHEGYPGHHLQLSCANLNPSYARLLSNAVESVEGWAHYCEAMMKEQGFGNDPATRFAQMTDQVWRACRIVIDVDLHRGRMTFDEAVDFLVRETAMERPGAVAEVKRYSYTPAYPLSYLVGKHLITKLRADVRRGLGSQYSDKFFHDTYLYAGSIPMKYMREIFTYKIGELRRLRRRGL